MPRRRHAAASPQAVSDSESSDVAEIVDITVDSEDGGDTSEVQVLAGAPPLWFQGYRRGRELGRGVSGQVFVCHRTGCNNGFAVKAVNLRRLQLRPNAEREWKKLCREVDILRKLPPHPNIVQLVDTFEEGNWFMIILELVGGGDLFTVLTARATPRLLEPEASFVLRQLSDGLDFLHRQKVIHRDLKLENILVASQRKERPSGLVFYVVKITDFGLSKHVVLGTSVAQSTVGTRPYTAPEVLTDGSHGFSSDLWCLGVLLYVLLAGRFPFDCVPAQQSHIDNIVEAFPAGEAAKCVLSGFLQIEPSLRLSLSALRSQEWLQERDAIDSFQKPHKRHRTGPKARSRKGSDSVPDNDPVSIEAILSPLPVVIVECSQDLVLNKSSEIREDAQSDPFACEPFGETASGIASAGKENTSPTGIASPLTADFQRTNITNLTGTWTPFAEEAAIRLSEVRPPSKLPDVMQVHMVTPDREAGFILGKNGTRIQQIALDAGCQVWMTTRDGDSDRRVVILGNYKQCKTAQELVHEQLANARRSDWRDTEAEVILFVRAEAAGVVTGRHGFVLNQIRKQSGAQIQLLREEVEGQRPCIVKGMLQNVLRAERHVFDLVRAVPFLMDECSEGVAPGVTSTFSAESLEPRL